MKTLKKTLASLANAELYAVEKRKVTTTTAYVPSYGDIENSDGDNWYYLDSYTTAQNYGAWNSARAASVRGWREQAYYKGYTEIWVQYGTGCAQSYLTDPSVTYNF